MELTITGKHLDLSPAQRSHIERKLGKLTKHLPNILEAKVEITEEKTKSREDHFVAQVTMVVNGAILRGEVRGALRDELEYFIKCAANGEKPTVILPKESREAVRACLAAEESARTGEVVKIG